MQKKWPEKQHDQPIKSEGFKAEKRLNFNRKGVLSGLKEDMVN